jgi:hypothetical protein
MFSWICATCSSKINPFKHWMGLEKHIKCRNCGGLNAIDRSQRATLGIGALGYLSYLATHSILGVPKWQAAIIVVSIAAILDLAFFNIKKVGLIESLSGQKNP